MPMLLAASGLGEEALEVDGFGEACEEPEFFPLSFPLPLPLFFLASASWAILACLAASASSATFLR
jgi:hypothetical protein